MEAYFNFCHQVHLQIMRALALALELPDNFFDPLHCDKDSELRLLHYPECPRKDLIEGNKTRIAEHTDFGSITLLFQDGAGGLQVQHQKSGDFYPVECRYPVMLVNVGDSMQRWTNDYLQSICHRVTLPASDCGKSTTVPERYSIAYFGKPNRKACLYPFPKFVTDERPSAYGHLSALDYNQSKLLRTYDSV